MSRRDTGVVVAHGVPTIGLFLQGVLYIVTPRFMPYHADALGGVTWDALPSHYQGFLLGVIKAMGAGLDRGHARADAPAVDSVSPR